MKSLVLVSALFALFIAIFVSLPLLAHEQYWFNRRSEMAADLVVTNAVIFTSDDSLPFADSMAVRNGRVLHVGNYSSVMNLVVYGTKELNLKGKIVVPGFIDSHLHFIAGGLQDMSLEIADLVCEQYVCFRDKPSLELMAQVELGGINEKDEFVRRIKEAARNKKPGSWILGGGWNNDLWGGDLPEANWIDSITPHNPVWLTRMDGHMGLANSVAQNLAGITISSEDPEGGSITRTLSGMPTGILVDSAMKLLLPFIPERTVNERREALERATNLSLARGVTTVVDFGRFVPGTSVEPLWDDFSDVYQWADSSRKMRIRVCLFFPLETWSRLLSVVNNVGRSLSEWIYLGGVKAFSDGSLGSSSALFYEPYVGEPQNYGLQVMDSEKLLNLTLASDKAGLQVAIHAIGDKANDLVLDVYSSVMNTNGMKDRRFRIEHAQHLAPGTPARFGKLGIVASVQPEHILCDYQSATNKLGVDRAEKGSYLFQSLLKSNAQLVFGSDWPVADINPLGGIRTALKRNSPTTWDNAWMPTESVSVEDALKAHTISAARGCFLDEVTGSLSAGKLADFVVLSSDSWDHFAAQGSASVESTFVAGAQAYP